MISVAKLITLTYALVVVVRGRFRLGIACLAMSAYLVLAMATSLPATGSVLFVNLPGLPRVWQVESAPSSAHALLPGGLVLAESPIVFGVISLALSVVPLVVAFRRADAEHPDSEIAKGYRPIVRALIVAGAVDAISLVILTFASMLSSPF